VSDAWDPTTYGDLVASISAYDELQAAAVAALNPARGELHRVLDLGTGTGETARRVLDAHPGARLVGVDGSAAMLDAARTALPADRTELHVGRFLVDELPAGPFDACVSVLAIHHLVGDGKAELFLQIAARLRTGARFVLGDVVLPDDPAAARAELSDRDHPSTIGEQLAWLAAAGLPAELAWRRDDLAVLVGDRA